MRFCNTILPAVLLLQASAVLSRSEESNSDVLDGTITDYHTVPMKKRDSNSDESDGTITDYHTVPMKKRDFNSDESNGTITDYHTVPMKKRDSNSDESDGSITDYHTVPMKKRDSNSDESDGSITDYHTVPMKKRDSNSDESDGSITDYHTVPMKKRYIKFDFDKLRGDSPATAEAGAAGAAKLVKRSDGTALVYLKNEQTFYSVNIGVGTPEQNQTLLIDTGSSDLWVMGSNNPYCAGSSGSSKNVDAEAKDIRSWFSSLTAELTTLTQSATFSQTATSVASSDATLSCSEYGTFATDSSSSFKSNNSEFYISYGDGTYAAGLWGSDKVTLQNVEIPRVNFAVANESTSEFGVMGIGMEDLESTNTLSEDPHTYINFPSALVLQGDIHTRAFSLYLNTLDATKGSILFGGIDHSKYSGTLYTVPIINTYKNQGYANPIRFEVTLQGLGMRANDTDTTFTTTKIPVVLDSGSTLSYLPPRMVSAAASKLGATYSSQSGLYIFECSEISDDDSFVFDFGGFQIQSSLSNYVLETSSSSWCALGMIPQTSGSYILGDNFLTAAYVVFDIDNMQISMAQADYSNDSEDVEIISSTVPSAVSAPMYSSTFSSTMSIVTGGNIFTLSSNGAIATSANSTVTSRSSSGARSGSATSTSGTSSSDGKSNGAAAIAVPKHGLIGFLATVSIGLVAGLL
ncbi:LAME_0G07118g1_1 [Lachancea meyersii CBS 8951]|uniref:LAME_0G07118g1_1 n=1 Tax=Lachancea meyersii CBS 8951 TaxID=1266667 RepID=A0A1G4K7T4_9SACH|nr:LAME_0G07118g1_1 [Lachancea meyersii CBS 8951]